MAELPVTMLQAALGATVSFDTLDGPQELAVKAGTQPNDTIRLSGLGVPRANGRGRGDLHVVVRVDVPKKLTKSEAARLREVAIERGELVDPGPKLAQQGAADRGAGGKDQPYRDRLGRQRDESESVRRKRRRSL